MNILEILLGQIPEAIYFSLFMIVTKNIKARRIPFMILMILEYVLLLNILPYSVWIHILYFVLSFLIMKILYRDESNVTDIFTMSIASVILMIISMISYIVTFGNRFAGMIVNRILMIALFIIFKNKLPSINTLYSKLWNRGKHSYKMKSTTFRALNLIIFNFSFFIINLGIIFYYWKG